jgi:DNA-directed RNA polymerase subunit F
MHEFKKETIPEINNDDKLGYDYVKQFTNLHPEKINDLKEIGDKVLSIAQNKKYEDSCEYDVVTRDQTKHEESLGLN